MHTLTKKKAPTGNKRGRPKATEVVANTNRKMDEYYRKKPVQSDAAMPLLHAQEEKKMVSPARPKSHDLSQSKRRREPLDS